MQKSLTKKLGMTVAAIAMAATGLFTATDAEAVPAFARQTGMTCNSCHFQSFPALNGMGRSFRSGGYTMQGTQPALEGENLNIPSNMNFSVAWKAFYVMEEKKYADGTSKNHVAMMDELAMLIGGRASSSVGYLFEVPGEFASIKMHFNVTDNVALIPYATDALGDGYGFELMNTAIQRSQRPIEDRKGMMFGHVIDKKSGGPEDSGIGLGTGAVSGLAIVLHDPSYFVNISLHAPQDWRNNATSDYAAAATWIRAAFFFDLAGFESGVGLGSRSGKYLGMDWGVDTNGDPVIDYEGATASVQETYPATYLDFQMQGQVGGNDMGVYFSSTTVNKPAGTTGDWKASGIGLLVKYSVSPQIQPYFAMTTGTVGTATDNKYGYTSIGVEYLVAQNIKLMAFNSKDNSTGGKGTTKIGWFAGL